MTLLFIVLLCIGCSRFYCSRFAENARKGPTSSGLFPSQWKADWTVCCWRHSVTACSAKVSWKWRVHRFGSLLCFWCRIPEAVCYVFCYLAVLCAQPALHKANIEKVRLSTEEAQKCLEADTWYIRWRWTTQRQKDWWFHETQQWCMFWYSSCQTTQHQETGMILYIYLLCSLKACFHYSGWLNTWYLLLHKIASLNMMRAVCCEPGLPAGQVFKVTIRRQSYGQYSWGHILFKCQNKSWAECQYDNCYALWRDICFC